MRLRPAGPTERPKIHLWHSKPLNLLISKVFIVLSLALIGGFWGAEFLGNLTVYWPWEVPHDPSVPASTAGMILGALLGGLAGWKIGKRVSLANRARSPVTTTTQDTSAEAPVIPAVDQAARAKGVLFALIGAGLLAVAIITAVPKHAFIRNAARAEGVVVRQDHGPAHVTIEFTTASGQKMSYAQNGDVYFRRGDHVVVLYDPEAPGLSACADRFGALYFPQMLMCGIGLAFLAIGLLAASGLISDWLAFR